METLFHFGTVLLALCSTVSGIALKPRQQSELRILPLGDSITYGWWSTTLNGYRNDLLQMLQFDNKYQVQYTGYQKSGTMDQNVHEGFPGATIKQIHTNGFEALNRSLPLPNVILLHAGTNDAINAFKNKNPGDVDVEQVAEQMINDLNDLVSDIFKQAPDVCLILSQIIMSADMNVQKLNDKFNGYIPYIVNNYKGKNILGVSMSNIDLNGGDHDSVYPDDPVHPGNDGFAKMASNFFEGILAADGAGKIPALDGPFDPAPHASLGDVATNPGNEWAYQCDLNATWSAKTASFGGVANVVGGSYSQKWESSSAFSNNKAGQALNGGFVWFGDIDNDGLADYIFVEPSRGSLHVWKNLGGGSWKDLGITATGTDTTDGAGIIIADMNSDGFADYLWQSANGDTIYLWYNYYGNGWVQENVTASGFPGTRQTTHVADINGDGRADLVWVDSSGNVNAWINTGIGTDITWIHTGNVGSNVGPGGLSATFSDVDGDGRSDYVYVNDDGSMDVWLNPDLTGLGNPPAFKSAGAFAPSSGFSPNHVKLADLDGDGRADYIVIDSGSGSMTVVLNKGSDGYGQLQLADANQDGKADVFLIGNSGNVQAWQNNGGSDFSPKKSVYQDPNQLGPKYIRVADVNGDGNTDIVTIDPHTCQLQAYTGNGDFTFNQSPVTIWSQGKPQGCQDCASIHFTDNNADGRADLICLTSDATAWLTFNNPPGEDFHSLNNINWTYFGWILINQGVTRNQARFVDLNGDGQDDVMTVAGNGDVHAYVSNTLAALLGGRQEFAGDGTAYSKILLADMNGDGRADYLEVDLLTGVISAFLNQCPDGGYPRKPGQPRPNSPGTSLNPIAPAAPSFTASRTSPSGSGPMTSTTPANAPASPTGSRLPSWASGDWTTMHCSTSIAAGSLGGRPTDVPQARQFWSQSGAEDALNQMFAEYDRIDPRPDFEAFVRESLTNDTSTNPDICKDITNADCLAVSHCQDVGYPALFYIASSINTIKALHNGLWASFLTSANVVAGSDWNSTFLQDDAPIDSTAIKRAVQALEGFIAVGLGVFFGPLGELVGPVLLGAAQVAIGDAINAGIGDSIEQMLMSQGIDGNAAELEFRNLINGTMTVLRSYQAALAKTDFTSAGGLLQGMDTYKLQAYMSGGITLVDNSVNIGASSYTDLTLKIMYEFAFQGGWYLQEAAAFNWPFVFYIDHSVYSCNTYDFDNAGTIAGDSRRFSYWASYGDGPKIDPQGGWCDEHLNTYLIMNAKYYHANFNNDDGKYSLFGQFPSIDDLNGASVNNWGGVSLRDITISSVRYFVQQGFVNDFSSRPDFKHFNPFDFSGIPPAGFFPFPVCTSADQFVNTTSFDMTNRYNDPSWPCGRAGGTDTSDFISVYPHDVLDYTAPPHRAEA